MSEPRIASCSCGALSTKVYGEPFTVAICSCEECQRRTGSAFGYSGYWDEAGVEIEGDNRRRVHRGRVCHPSLLPCQWWPSAPDAAAPRTA